MLLPTKKWCTKLQVNIKNSNKKLHTFSVSPFSNCKYKKKYFFKNSDVLEKTGDISRYIGPQADISWATPYTNDMVCFVTSETRLTPYRDISWFFEHWSNITKMTITFNPPNVITLYKKQSYDDILRDDSLNFK